jgi:hypothetical protein
LKQLIAKEDMIEKLEKIIEEEIDNGRGPAAAAAAPVKKRRKRKDTS